MNRVSLWVGLKPFVREAMKLGPFSVEILPIGAIVLNGSGQNCLSFEDSQSAIATTQEIAEALCDELNSGN